MKATILGLALSYMLIKSPLGDFSIVGIIANLLVGDKC